METDIQNALSDLCRDPQAADWGAEWKDHIFAAVGQIARTRGYLWLTAGNPREWLWDAVAQERDDQGNLLSVPIALECEWMGKGEIKYDFEKLLASRAELRVMICSAATRNGA